MSQSQPQQSEALNRGPRARLFGSYLLSQELMLQYDERNVTVSKDATDSDKLDWCFIRVFGGSAFVSA